MSDLTGKTALVTGASSGIGLAFARDLAARGADLVIAARREAEMEKLAAELREKTGRKVPIKVMVIAIDLARPEAPAELFARTEGAGTRIDVLINNAGFGTHQYFVDTPWERAARELQLNIVTLTELSHRFGSEMARRGAGHILNVASVGAYAPCPGYATYAAGKAYVRNFTEALAAELAERGVRVLCLCPGATTSEWATVAGQEQSLLHKAGEMSAERCAAIGLSALFGARRNVISGWMNKVSMFALRFLPRRLIVWMSGTLMGRPPKPQLPPPAAQKH
jgi:short-subunit dehydrogenase